MEDNSRAGRLRLRPSERPEVTERLKNHLEKQLRKMKRAYRGSVRKSDAAAVHDLRVATRRLGAVLQVVTFSNPEKVAKKASKKLKKLRRVVSAQRDIDVLLKKMQERAKEAASKRREQLWNVVICASRSESQAARRKSHLWLRSFDIDQLEKQIRKIVRKHLKDDFSWGDLGAAAHRAEQKWKQTAKAAHRVSDSSRFHDVRIKTKTFRYLVELVPRIGGSDRSDGLIEWLKNTQDEFGEWHDQPELCRRLTLILSDDAGLQADPIATALIDAARNRTRLNDQHARRTIDSIRNVQGRKQIAVMADLDESEGQSNQ